MSPKVTAVLQVAKGEFAEDSLLLIVHTLGCTQQRAMARLEQVGLQCWPSCTAPTVSSGKGTWWQHHHQEVAEGQLKDRRTQVEDWTQAVMICKSHPPFKNQQQARKACEQGRVEFASNHEEQPRKTSPEVAWTARLQVLSNWQDV